MWNVMIETLQGKPQYFHGIDWDTWVPKSLAEIEKEEREAERALRPKNERATNERLEAIKDAARQRNKAMSIRTRKTVLDALAGLKSASTNDLAQLCGIGAEYMAKLLTKYFKEGYIAKRRNGAFGVWVFVRYPE